MELRNWALLVLGLVLLFLIVNFFRTIFKSDVKRYSHDRLYVDYSTYKTKSTPGVKTRSYTSPAVFQQVDLASRYLHEGRSEFTAKTFSQAWVGAFKNAPVPPEERIARNESFEKYRNFAGQSIEGIIHARFWFGKKNYAQAVQELNTVLQNLDRDDLHHRMQVYENLAECYFFTKNKELYVENKVNYIKTLRQIRDLVRKSFPDKQLDEKKDWMTSEEATQQMLRIRSHAERLPGIEGETLIRRAEFDLEVARRINS
jgi:hypothetical protein